MPIRFRCAYCNQLMGIAQRKAGTVVNCPKCQGQVVVPTPGAEEAGGPEDDKPNLFEEGNLSHYLPGPEGENVGAPQARPAAPPSRAPSPGAWNAPQSFPSNPPMPRGILLTPGMFTLVCVLIVLLLGLAFFLGLLLGKSASGEKEARGTNRETVVLSKLER